MCIWFVQSTEYADLKKRTEWTNLKKNHETVHSHGRRPAKGNAVTILKRNKCEKIPDKEDFLSTNALKNRNKNIDNNI